MKKINESYRKRVFLVLIALVITTPVLRLDLSWISTGILMVLVGIIGKVALEDLLDRKMTAESIWTGYMMLFLWYIYMIASGGAAYIWVNICSTFSIIFLHFLLGKTKDKNVKSGDLLVIGIAIGMFGWQQIITLILVSMLLASVGGLSLMLTGRATLQTQIPLIPFIYLSLSIYLWSNMLIP